MDEHWDECKYKREQLMQVHDTFFDLEFLNFQKDVSSFVKRNNRVFLTSSFQTQSLPLLHMVSRMKERIDILVIDTGYLFPETYAFIDKVSNMLGVEVTRIKSSLSLIDQVVSPGKFLFSEDNEKCCYINKIYPLQQAYKKYDVWISGIRADQSSTRASKMKIEKNADGIIRFHPMLNWSSKQVYYYRKKYNLPAHPLEQDGYLSIGCLPCTTRYCEFLNVNEREGRWQGLKKNECGLHTEI